ncbi:hypothetical protein [Vulcanisaeta distributa]|uniref:Uncharacterized protein n=1 Tax=Vulcanisaeta distributa (strain DSM 14429 / JCM 11212 / NBRC 100878 / IC-017) TaxID=572478 RepID=E1QPP9_VULDI|nr:hypothetical protein [Vulcanisaeta distributa]ADN50345.1 conserved hypothetical protein [Vulcanisaeta distributa DSM 14429]
MMTNKWITYALTLAIILILISSITYANTIYGPAPTPVVYAKYVITMNLTDSRPTVQFLSSIVNEYPLTYHEDSLIDNVTPVWVATADKEFTLYIINASETTAQQWVLLNATAITNATGGITWVLKVPLYLLYPQPVYANWYVLITEDLNGEEYVVFAFKTSNESLTQVLGGLSTVGGYLIALNGEPYYLWNYYYGYNPATKGVGEYYEVSLPGLSVFTMWVGQGINASSWPSSGFQEVLQVLSYSFSEYVNSSLITHLTLSPNMTIGEITNYGYAIYQRPRLVPFGPVIYISPILLMPNGTIVNPSCIPNTYYLLQVNYITQSGYSIPVYETENYPMGLYLLNGSLLFGGYLQAYDFFNGSVIPITPVQYLVPTYQSQVSAVSWCTLQVFNYEDSQVASGNVSAGIVAIGINGSTAGVSTQYVTNRLTESLFSIGIGRVIMELRLR